MSRPSGNPKIIQFAGGSITLNVVKGSRKETFTPIGGSVERSLPGDLIINREGFRFIGEYEVYMEDSAEAQDILDLFTDPSLPVHAPGCFFQPYDDFSLLVVYGLIDDFQPIFEIPVSSEFRCYSLRVISTNVLYSLPWPDIDRGGWRKTHRGVV